MPLLLPGQESGSDEPGKRFERHHHFGAYAALVVRGTMDEAGDRGRFRGRAGDVLVHRAFDAHANFIGPRGAAYINFPLQRPLEGGFGRVDDLDQIVRTYERDPVEAGQMLRHRFRTVAAGPDDWPDMLARDLAGGGAVSLRCWANRHGLHPASVSRGFRLAYGLSPKRYRLEHRTSEAARRIRFTADPFSIISFETGFADQAHMTRAIARMFGTSPTAIRRAG